MAKKKHKAPRQISLRLDITVPKPITNKQVVSITKRVLGGGLVRAKAFLELEQACGEGPTSDGLEAHMALSLKYKDPVLLAEPKCKTCEHWQPVDNPRRRAFGTCTRFKHLGGQIIQVFYGDTEVVAPIIETDEDFGCNLYDRKLELEV